MKISQLVIEKYGKESVELATAFLLDKNRTVKITCEEDNNVINILKENNINFEINECMNGTKYIDLV